MHVSSHSLKRKGDKDNSGKGRERGSRTLHKPTQGLTCINVGFCTMWPNINVCLCIDGERSWTGFRGHEIQETAMATGWLCDICILSAVDTRARRLPLTAAAHAWFHCVAAAKLHTSLPPTCTLSVRTFPIMPVNLRLGLS